LFGFGFYGYNKGGVDGALERVVWWGIVFFSVFLHEIGHVIAAKKFGIITTSISLSCIGGAANFASPIDKPSARFFISISGPIVNAVITLLSLSVLYATRPVAYDDHIFTLDGFLIVTFAVNAVLFIFNMLPIYPLDGGQIMRAVFSSFLNKVNEKRFTLYVSVIGVLVIGSYSAYAGWWFTVGLAIYLLLISYLELGNGGEKLQITVSNLIAKEAVKQLNDIKVNGFNRSAIADMKLPSKNPGRFVFCTADGERFAHTNHWADYAEVDERVSQIKIVMAFYETTQKIGGTIKWELLHHREG
jgi:Zn-dependent protease